MVDAQGHMVLTGHTYMRFGDAQHIGELASFWEIAAQQQ